jgi:hypothetical protein
VADVLARVAWTHRVPSDALTTAAHPVARAAAAEALLAAGYTVAEVGEILSKTGEASR